MRQQTPNNPERVLCLGFFLWQTQSILTVLKFLRGCGLIATERQRASEDAIPAQKANKMATFQENAELLKP
jgi:hypothetical protein